MSAYQNAAADILPKVEVPMAEDSPTTPVAKLRRSWYSLTFSDDEYDTDVKPGNVSSEVSNSISSECPANLQTTDACSDASTDVGVDDLEDRELGDDGYADGETSLSKDVHHVQCERLSVRPCFQKLNRQQRIDQLRRVLDEFCALDFHIVDASSQGGLVYRMLTILKSLKESTVFHGEEGRCEESRLTLLGLGDAAADAIAHVVHRAEQLAQARTFGAAFAVLRELVPRLSVQMCMEAKTQMSEEEEEAMKLRRWQKRQRQREERREQREAERSERSKRKN